MARTVTIIKNSRVDQVYQQQPPDWAPAISVPGLTVTLGALVFGAAVAPILS
jgi:hypothetical protein